MQWENSGAIVMVDAKVEMKAVQRAVAKVVSMGPRWVVQLVEEWVEMLVPSTADYWAFSLVVRTGGLLVVQTAVTMD